MPVPCPQVACAPQSLPAPCPGLRSCFSSTQFWRQKSHRERSPTLAQVAAVVVGVALGDWPVLGDAQVMLGSCSALCLHLWLPQAMGKARRAKVGTFWVSAGLMDRLPASLHAVGCEAAACQGQEAPGHIQSARRSRGKLAISKAPRTPNSLPAAGRDTTASSSASPSIRRTSWSSPGPEHPSAPFCPWVQLPGQAPYGQVEQHSGTLRLHPKCQEIKQNERRNKGRPGEGWRGGAGVSKLPPAICCQLGDSRAPQLCA